MFPPRAILKHKITIIGSKNNWLLRFFQQCWEIIVGRLPRVFKRGQCHGGKAGSFQNGLLPPIGPPLAGFGRYFGVRKLVPGATFWAHSRPPGGPKTARKIPKTSWEFPCALTPFALPPFANSWFRPPPSHLPATFRPRPRNFWLPPGHRPATARKFPAVPRVHRAPSRSLGKQLG